MWLVNASKLQLEETWGETDKQYAILSHRWEQEEVSFQAMQNPSVASTLKGYAKIQATCRQALNDGYQYVWIDTCCINKESSAELSEAINSMYRWYEASSVCYAYLSDISPGVSFETSIWFSRGWTLQELLSPSHVVFYDCHWNFLGTKETLSKEISGRTKIEESILTGEIAVANQGIAQRMAWAANRVTTRIEDMAYCLLGIFNVHMPLLYGEGKQAFLRLQEEIIKRDDDTSIFAWPIHRDNQPGLLADAPSAFAGCQQVIPLSSRKGRSSYSMTSRGLSIKFDGAIHFSTDTYLVRLDCVDLSKANFMTRAVKEYRTGILLRRLLEDDQFARVQYDGTSISLYHLSTWTTSSNSTDAANLRIRKLDVNVVQELKERHFGLNPYAPRLYGFRFSDISLFNSFTKDGDLRARFTPPSAWNVRSATITKAIMSSGIVATLDLKGWSFTIKMLKFGFDWEWNPVVFVATAGGLTGQDSAVTGISVSIYRRDSFDDLEYSIIAREGGVVYAMQCRQHEGLWAIRGDRVDGIDVDLGDVGCVEVKRKVTDGVMEWVVSLTGFKTSSLNKIFNRGQRS